MRHRGSPDDVVEVEIVEVNDLTGAPLERADDPPDEAAAHPTRRRVLRWLGIGVITALALAVVVVNVAEARRDSARREALADLPWVLPPMDGPLEEVWRAPGDWVMAETDGMIVTTSSATDMTLRGIDTATGEVLWERSNADEYCTPILDEATSGPVISLIPSRPEMLMCTPIAFRGEDLRPTDGGEALPTDAATFTVAFVDLATGAEQGAVTSDGEMLALDEVDGEILLMSLRPDAGIDVLRADPHSGRTAWRWASEPGILPDPATGGWSWSVDEDSGVLQLEADRTIALSLESGAEVPPGESLWDKAYLIRVASPSGQVVEWSYDQSGEVSTARVLEPDGSTRFEVAGEPWLVWFDDGSVPDLLVMRRAEMAGAAMQDVTLAGVDIATGEERWSVLDGYSSPLFLLDGVAISTTGSSTSALDMRTGRWLWERPAASEMMSFYPLTDGEVVLVPVSDGQTDLAALDLRTGEEQWRMPAPADLVDARVAQDRTLLLITGSEVVAYR